MAGNRIQKPDFIREFRLGLVVYGGVSLAVYMNGVCREFYNAVRGRGVYKLIKALTDSDIVVDIISGTSAGGINGVLLSYALTNSSKDITFDFKDFSGVWRDSGDISELLRKVNSADDVNSILDGEGYYQAELAAAFQSVWKKQSKAPDDDWFSDFNELDLFVTGTDVLGKVSRQFDNTGKLIEVNDHHAVFILKHRKDRNKTPFSPDDNGIPQKALAKLCRITSCFPVAFPVVSVNLDEVDPTSPDGYIDKKLVEWGNLNNRVKPKERPKNGYQLHFVDGGVLDNRPFSYTIREIYYRHFHRPVIRKLFYIDPSPDKFLDSNAFKKMAKPNIWESAMDSLVGLPRYESIAVDLQEIAEKNERVRRYRFLRSSVVSSAVETLGDQVTADNSSKQTYLRCRLIGLRDRVLPIITGLTQANNSTSNTDQANTLQIAADLLAYYPDPEKQRAREEYLNEKGFEVEGLDVDYSIRKHFFIQEEIVQAIASDKYSHFHECIENLARYLNRMLSLLEVIKFAIDSMFLTDQIQVDFAKLIQKTKDVNTLPELNYKDKEVKLDETKRVRNDVFDYLLHLHRFLLDPDQLLGESSLESPQLDQSYPESATPSFFKALLDDLPVTFKIDHLDKWLPTKSVDNVLRQLKMRAKNLENVDTLDRDICNMPMIWHEKYKFQKDIAYHSILSCVDDISRQLIERLGTSLPDNNDSLEQAPIKELNELSEKLLLKFCHFDSIDQQVYPYEYLSDIQSDGLLEIARISPDDSQKGFGKNKKLEERLAGLQLRAFGGFFKKSWRANDILWGRLDGLNRLVDCLLTPTTVQSFRKFKQRNEHIENSQLVEEALPNATPEERQTIVDILDKLANKEQIKDADFQDFLERIVLAGQRAILTTDLKNVLNDTIAEQFSWNQQLGIPDSADLYEIGYRSEHDRTSSSIDQLQGLKKIDTLLDCLLEPKSKFKDGCQKYIEEVMKVHGQEGVENYLREQLKIAFPHSTESTREDLSNRLFLLLLKLNNKQITRFDKTSKAFASGFILALTPAIDLLLSVSEEEVNALNTPNPTASSETINEIAKFNTQLVNVSSKLKEALNKLKPIFSPTDGYLDKPLIPYVTGSLVDSSIQVIMNDPQKMENYFRYQYRVGSEKVKENIPPIILNKLLARSALVIRDILRSAPTGEVLSKSPTFQFVDRLLRTFYFWVDANDPATSFVPKVLRPLLLFILAFVLALGTAFLVSQIPRLLLGVIITLLIAQLFYSTFGRKGPSKQAFRVFSILLVLMIIAHEFVGLPLPHKGTIRLKRLFNDYCPRIQTPLTAKDCKSLY